VNLAALAVLGHAEAFTLSQLFTPLLFELLATYRNRPITEPLAKEGILSITLEWQLVAHSQDLTPAEGAVASAIARRIRPGNQSEPIPFRTLYAESVGVSSKETIKRALIRLEALGVIQVSKQPKGSRKPSVISWVLTCPQECQLDHAKGNTRASATPLEKEFLKREANTAPDSDTPHSVGHDTPHSVGHLKKLKEREGSLVSFIRETLLELENPSPLQAQLLAAAQDLKTSGLVNTQAELIIVSKNPESTYSYLKAITLKDPHKLLPKPSVSEPSPAFTHLPPDLRDLELAKLNRPDPFAAQKALAND
jgi:hypothetical protein